MSPPARSNRSGLAEWARTVDRPLLIAGVLLMAAGLLFSLAAGPVAAERLRYDDRYHFVLRHAGFAVASMVVLFGVSVLDTVWARRLAGAVFVVSFLLMAAILVVGHEAKGGQRWLRFGGFSLQPSEMVKPAVIVLSGWLLAQRRLYPGGPWAPVALALFVSTLGLLLLQPDVGQSALLGMAFLATFFVSGLPWRWAAAFAGGALALGGALYATMGHVRARLAGFFDPTQEAYQVQKALEAQARGGLLGTGPGEGVIKRSIPDGHSDFIYSIVSEEYGLVVGLALIAAFLAITVRGLMLAGRLSDPYPRAAASGLFALFGLQAAINLAVNVNMIPAKGMTLPFISYGGSSLIGSALTLGLAIALVRKIPMRAKWRSHV